MEKAYEGKTLHGAFSYSPKIIRKLCTPPPPTHYIPIKKIFQKAAISECISGPLGQYDLFIT